MKTKILSAAATAAILVLVSASCSSGNGGDEDFHRPTTTIQAATPTSEASTTSTNAATATSSAAVEAIAEPVSAVMSFTTENGTGTITISGDDSPVVEWFAGQPGEITLDLFDADVGDVVSVVEELVSFWFSRDDYSDDAPPFIFVSASGDVTDSVGTSYVVEAQPFPPAPGTATTTTTTATVPGNTETTTTTTAVSEETATTTTTSSAVPETTTTTTSSAVPETTTTTTAAETEPTASLQVQVLNGSGVAGAAEG